MTALFAPDDGPGRPPRRRARLTAPTYRCPSCGRRTRRRIRRLPTLGYEDARCLRCTDQDLWPRQHTDRRHTGDRP